MYNIEPRLNAPESQKFNNIDSGRVRLTKLSNTEIMRSIQLMQECITCFVKTETLYKVIKREQWKKWEDGRGW